MIGGSYSADVGVGLALILKTQIFKVQVMKLNLHLMVILKNFYILIL